MDEARREVEVLCEAIAAAIARRDVAALRAVLAPGFVQRTHAGEAAEAAEALDAEAFLTGVAGIPGEIEEVRLESLVVDVAADRTGALATGVQRARVVVGGEVLEERRGYVDWFVRGAEGWRLQAAVDFAVAEERGGAGARDQG